MKGLLAKALLIIVILSSAVSAQVIDDPWGVLSRYLGTGYFQVPYPYSYDFKGGGARAEGMGGAFIGVSDDISAVSWNPAGLYRKDNPFDQPVMGLGYGTFSPKGTYDVDFLRQEYKDDDLFNNLTLASFLAPIRIKGHPFVISGSYTRISDEYFNGGLYFDTLLDWTPSDDDPTKGLWSADYRQSYHSGINTINLGFGTRLYGDISIGLAVNIYDGKGVSHQRFVETEEGIEDYYGQSITQVIDSTVVDSMSYSGVYFTIGLQYVKEKLSAGLVVRTPHTLKQTTDSSIYLSTTENGQLTSEGVQIFYRDDNLVELDMPVTVGAGVSYRPIERLLLALDAEYRPFGSGEVNRRDSLRLIPGEKDTEYFTTIDPKWNNVFVLRFGGEYMWSTGFSLLPLVPVRAGFGYTPIAQPDIDANSETATAKKTSFSLGAGVRWDQIYLDVSYTHSSLDCENLNFPQTSSNSSNSFDLTFTGYF